MAKKFWMEILPLFWWWLRGTTGGGGFLQKYLGKNTYNYRQSDEIDYGIVQFLKEESTPINNGITLKKIDLFHF